MNKTATQILQEAIFASVCEAIDAFKSNAGGMPNALVRDLLAVHGNTSFDTLPEPVQKAIKDAVQDTLRRLQREGYVVTPKTAPRPLQRPERARKKG